jgi:hypothetical protein
MISYDEHDNFLYTELEKCGAELSGFHQAKIGPCLQWSKIPDIQARFEKGYQDGQAKLLQDSILTTRAQQE